MNQYPQPENDPSNGGELGEFQLREPQPLGVAVELESDLLWERYFSNKTRSYEDVYNLWINPEITNPTIRQRLVTVLTAPVNGSLPYSHQELEVKQIYYAPERYQNNMSFERLQSVSKRFEDRPELISELTAGVLYWLENISGTTDQAQTSIHHPAHEYQRIILDLLPVSEEAVADRLFSHFLVNERPMPYIESTYDGYLAIRKLLMHDEIPHKYKLIGLAKWFDAAMEELNTIPSPLSERKGAVSRMVDCLQDDLRIRLRRNDCAKSNLEKAEIFDNIVRFLEVNLPSDEAYIMYSQYVESIGYSISDRELCLRFFMRHINHDIDYTEEKNKHRHDHKKLLRNNRLGEQLLALAESLGDTEAVDDIRSVIQELEEIDRKAAAERKRAEIENKEELEKQREDERRRYDNERSIQAQLRNS